MLACENALKVAADAMGGWQAVAQHELRLPARPLPSLTSPADGGGGGSVGCSRLSRVGRVPLLGRGRCDKVREVPRTVCAVERREASAYEKMLEDVEEKKRERTGVYREPPTVQPLSREIAEAVLALDRPDLSLPVEEPIEWRVSRRENPSDPQLEETTEEQRAQRERPLNTLPSNASRNRSVEERCNLRVRRSVSQEELDAMGVSEWPEYSWSQPIDLALVYDRVPEACYIEQGRVRVRPPQALEHDFCELAAGDFVRFPKYSAFIWEIVEAPLVRRYKFLIDLPPPPDAAEVLRLQLHERKMHEQQVRAELRYKKKPMKGREKQMRMMEAEIRKDLTDLRNPGNDKFSE